MSDGKGGGRICSGKSSTLIASDGAGAAATTDGAMLNGTPGLAALGATANEGWTFMDIAFE
jgi:hypothetical protein